MDYPSPTDTKGKAENTELEGENTASPAIQSTTEDYNLQTNKPVVAKPVEENTSITVLDAQPKPVTHVWSTDIDGTEKRNVSNIKGEAVLSADTINA